MTATHVIGAWGSTDASVDFGFRYGFQIGDVLFEDSNNDGAQSAGEPRFADVELVLYTVGDVEVARTTTDSNGVYNFNSLEFLAMEPNTM